MTEPKILTWQLPDEPENVTRVTAADGTVWTKTDKLASSNGMAGVVEHQWVNSVDAQFSWGLLVRCEGPLTAPEPPKVNDTGHEIGIFDEQTFKDDTLRVIAPGETFPADSAGYFVLDGSETDPTATGRRARR